MKTVKHLSTEVSRDDAPENVVEAQPDHGMTGLSLDALTLVAGGDSIIVWPV